MLMQASFLGLAMAGGDSRAWEEAWESTLTEDELEALYHEGQDEMERRSAGHGDS